MLLFYCAAEAALPALRRHGLRDETGDGLRLWTTLDAAQAACEGYVLVIDADALPEMTRRDGAGGGNVAPGRVSAVPAEAFCNLDPYLPPQPVVAAGGCVVRPGDGEPEVLLIFRRGVWDLPKGKLDPGETPEAGALREVREEIGVDELHLGCALGTTVHGYERGGGYHVKTTHWFLMRTPAIRFRPEAREGIEAVAWVPWREAARRLGYPSLRRHLQQIEDIVNRDA